MFEVEIMNTMWYKTKLTEYIFLITSNKEETYKNPLLVSTVEDRLEYQRCGGRCELGITKNSITSKQFQVVKPLYLYQYACTNNTQLDGSSFLVLIGKNLASYYGTD